MAVMLFYAAGYTNWEPSQCTWARRDMSDSSTTVDNSSLDGFGIPRASLQPSSTWVMVGLLAGSRDSIFSISLQGKPYDHQQKSFNAVRITSFPCDLTNIQTKRNYLLVIYGCVSVRSPMFTNHSPDTKAWWSTQSLSRGCVDIASCIKLSRMIRVYPSVWQECMPGIHRFNMHSSDA